MDAEELRKLDEHADGVIRNWSFAALLANVPPPPFDMMAVGTTFVGMGSHLARIYGVKAEPARGRRQSHRATHVERGRRRCCPDPDVSVTV